MARTEGNRKAVIAGVTVGVILVLLYLWRKSPLFAPVPDPVWAVFVNTALIMFSAIFISVRLNKLIIKLKAWRRPGNRR